MPLRAVRETEPVDEQRSSGRSTEGDPTDEELTELALAADPDTALADDAVSLWDLGRQHGGDLLPEWYMPAPALGTRSFRGWRRWLVILIVVTFVALEAYGLCSTYGSVVLG